MIIMKTVIGLVSVIVSIFSLIKLRQAPSKKLTPRNNLKLISTYSSISGITDCVLSMIVISFISEGVYSIGSEIVVVEIFVLLWGIIWTCTVFKLKNRISKYYDKVLHDITNTEFKYINPYRVSIPIGGLGLKVLFWMLETTWIMQGNIP